MRPADPAPAGGRRPPAAARAVRAIAPVAGCAVLTGGLAAALAGGPTGRQVLVGVAVAAAAAVCGAVTTWLTRDEVRRLTRLDRAMARFAGAVGEHSIGEAVTAGVQELRATGSVVGWHLVAAPDDEPRAPQDVEHVVVADALRTGVPATLPEGTTGSETTRLLALPVQADQRCVAVVVLRLPMGAGAAPPDVEAFLERVGPLVAAMVAASEPGPAVASPAAPAAPAAPPSPPAPPAPSAALDEAAGPAEGAAPGAGNATHTDEGDVGTDGDLADAGLRQLVARGAHDLRTPLNTLTGMIDTLVQHDQRLTAAQREQFHVALQRSARRIAGWITALLDAAVAGGSSPADAATCRLQPLLEEAVEVSRAATAGLEVFVAPTDLQVVAAPASVVRVVGNLLANAGHHAPHGDTVEVEARALGDLVEVCVRDHGDGWGAGSAPSRDTAQARDNHHSGHGLGLASVRSEVAAWGGQVVLDDTPGGGATVRFTLPRLLVGEDGEDVLPTSDGRGSPSSERDLGWTIAGEDAHLRGVRRAQR